MIQFFYSISESNLRHTSAWFEYIYDSQLIVLRFKMSVSAYEKDFKSSFKKTTKVEVATHKTSIDVWEGCSPPPHLFT